MSRAEQLQQLIQLPLPSKKDEAWKYTSPKAFLEAAWDSSQSSSEVGTLDLLPFYKLYSLATLVFVDGKLREELCKNLSALKVSRFAAHSSQLAKSKVSGDFFERLNSEYLNEGISLELKGESAAPLVLIYVSTKSGDQFAANYRVQLTCAPGSKGSVVEVHHSATLVKTASQIVSHVDIGQNASLTYVKVQNGADAQHLSQTKFSLSRDARLESTQVALGGALVRQNLQVKFLDRGAEAIVNGLYLATGTEHIDNQTLIDHVVGNTTSSQLYKGILDGEARAVFTGGVRIRKDAQLANSSQLNNNLMLSQKAEIDTKPELEIEADDVKAAHGATIGQINPDHIFYLQSRALSKKQAVGMLAYGFAQDIVDRISDESIRNELSLLVKHKFSQFKVESL